MRAQQPRQTRAQRPEASDPERAPRDGGRAAARVAASLLAVGLAAVVAASGAGADSHSSEEKSMSGSEARGAVAEIDAFIEKQDIDKGSAGWKQKLPKPPQAAFDDGLEYFWKLSTNVGDLRIKLRPDVAPMHVSSTIYLTRLGFYDSVPFHRVISGFMAQGGDPTGSGRGGPGYQYDGEFSEKLRHDKAGLLSMANAGPGTDGSQFFLTFTATPHLDDRHTLFGEVVDGMDTLEKLEARGSRGGRPTEPLEIEKATIAVE